MRRKPAIFLALLLLLSIGGALFYHHLRNQRPSFHETDAFMRNEAATGDWQFVSHSSVAPFHYSRAGWWDYLHIRRSGTIEEDHYGFLHPAGKEAAIAVVRRKNGIVQYVYVSALPKRSSAATPVTNQMKALEKSIEDWWKQAIHYPH